MPKGEATRLKVDGLAGMLEVVRHVFGNHPPHFVDQKLGEFHPVPETMVSAHEALYQVQRDAGPPHCLNISLTPERFTEFKIQGNSG